MRKETQKLLLLSLLGLVSVNMAAFRSAIPLLVRGQRLTVREPVGIYPLILVMVSTVSILMILNL